jgi:hypothetical protein
MTPRARRIQVRLRPVFTEYGVSRAVLFGSVASGNDMENSDLDLLVDSGLRGLKFVGLVEAIREAVGMPVDVFDVTHIEKGSRIEQEILATGVAIYKREEL